MSQALISSITHNDNNLDLAFMSKFDLIETLDLSGPRLILEFNDRFSLIRNRLGVKPGDLLNVSFSIDDDWFLPGISNSMWFKILTMPVFPGDILRINCFQADIAILKEPVTETRVFNDVSPETVLHELFPSATNFNIDPFPIHSFQIMPGERPSLMLRQMTRELGAAIWYQRGIVCCRDLLTIADSTKNEPNHIFAWQNAGAGENQIAHYETPRSENLISDIMVRNSVGWSMTGGFMASTLSDTPPEFTSVNRQDILDNLSKVLVPSVDFTSAGNVEITAGLMLNVQWNLDQTDSPLDESLPEDVLVGTVAHYYGSNKYWIRVKGVDLAPPHGPLGM